MALEKWQPLLLTGDAGGWQGTEDTHVTHLSGSQMADESGAELSVLD